VQDVFRCKQTNLGIILRVVVGDVANFSGGRLGIHPLGLRGTHNYSPSPSGGGPAVLGGGRFEVSAGERIDFQPVTLPFPIH